MNKFVVRLFALGIFFVLVLPVMASEGIAKLESVGGEMGSCFVASVHVEGRFRVLMTCRDLRSALDPVRNKYVAWTKNGENLKKLGEIENGKLQASMSDEFKEVVITVEESNRINKSSGGVVLAGKMEKIELDSGQARMTDWDETVVTPMVTPTPTSMPKIDAASATGAGSVFKILGKALLTGFLVLLGVVGVLSYLSRRKK